MHTNCTLCSCESSIFQVINNKNFFKCSGCLSVFVDPKKLPDFKTERERYLTHNNEVFNLGYQKFTSPIFDVVLANYKSYHKGLDFGAGTGPVISHMLKEKGYSIELYDPFFHNQPELLSNKYDYIVCCEVMEHFHNPYKEFSRLREMLNPGGELICMTEVLTDDIDFAKWYYKNDVTHVFFYHPKSLDFIKLEFNFSGVSVYRRLIRFII